MESMKTWENIKFSIKDSSIANVTALGWVDCNVFVTLISLLIAELLCVMRIFFDFISQCCNLTFIIFKTSTQMLFHLFNFCFLREFLK